MQTSFSLFTILMFYSYKKKVKYIDIIDIFHLSKDYFYFVLFVFRISMLFKKAFITSSL